jgi:hypothetical protein
VGADIGGVIGLGWVGFHLSKAAGGVIVLAPPLTVTL